ncbi:hypothetical protein BDB01DRAFT_727260, partial [Pilobolus umbonatus]
FYSGSASSEPTIDIHSILTVTTNTSLIKQYQDTGLVPPQPLPVLDHEPIFKVITPVFRKKLTEAEEKEAIPDEYYIKRHRRYEMEEKKQKNREKERLRHGYYQQLQLVDRIKTMDRSLLQSIVSSIRHRNKSLNDKETEIETSEGCEDEYLSQLHQLLLNDAEEHLQRYEALGLVKPSHHKQHEYDSDTNTIPSISPSPPPPTKFQESLQMEQTKPKKKEFSTFNKEEDVSKQVPTGSRRSDRRVKVFGVSLPNFTSKEFSLPIDILDYARKTNKR